MNFNKPIFYVKNNKKIIDYSLKFPENIIIYFDLIQEIFNKVDKKIQDNIIKINRIQRFIFNYKHPSYCDKKDNTNYYISRAYLDGEIQENQVVYVYCFSEKTEIFVIDWKFIEILKENKTKLQKYKHLENKSGVYIIKLQHNKYYIGSSHNIYRRLIQHWSKSGSKWTCIFSPVELISWISTDDLIIMENLITKIYVSKYGYLNVRGGNFYI